MLDYNHNYIFIIQLQSYFLIASFLFVYNTQLFVHMIIWYQVFLSNVNNSYIQVFLYKTNDLHTVIGFQVFLSNTKNL